MRQIVAIAVAVMLIPNCGDEADGTRVIAEVERVARELREGKREPKSKLEEVLAKSTSLSLESGGHTVTRGCLGGYYGRMCLFGYAKTKSGNQHMAINMSFDKASAELRDGVIGNQCGCGKSSKSTPATALCRD